MATIEIGLKRYLRIVYFIIILSILTFPAFMTIGDSSDWFSRKSIMMAVFLDTMCGVIIILGFSLTKKMDFPVRIIIEEDHLDIHCKSFFLKKRSYSGVKKDVSVSFIKKFGLPSWNYLTITHSKMKKHQAILFSRLTLNKELLSQILDELKEHGYDVNESWG